MYTWTFHPKMKKESKENTFWRKKKTNRKRFIYLFTHSFIHLDSIYL